MRAKIEKEELRRKIDKLQGALTAASDAKPAPNPAPPEVVGVPPPVLKLLQRASHVSHVMLCSKVRSSSRSG